MKLHILVSQLGDIESLHLMTLSSQLQDLGKKQ